MDSEPRQADTGAGNESNQTGVQTDPQYKSLNKTKKKEDRATPKAKHKRGDLVSKLINEDTDNAEILECKVHNAELNEKTNQWEYQLVDENGIFLESGKYYAEDSFTKRTA